MCVCVSVIPLWRLLSYMDATPDPAVGRREPRWGDPNTHPTYPYDPL